VQQDLILKVSEVGKTNKKMKTRSKINKQKEQKRKKDSVRIRRRKRICKIRRAILCILKRIMELWKGKQKTL